jgi:hypothetical protein
MAGQRISGPSAVDDELDSMATVHYDAHDKSGSPYMSREFVKGTISIATDMMPNEGGR